MAKADIKDILKEGLKETFEKGYTVKDREQALEQLSEGLANKIATYVDNRVTKDGASDQGARLLLSRLIDELLSIEIVLGRNVNKEKLNQIKSEL